jgi:DNA repair protein RecN (Recombination protein N)
MLTHLSVHNFTLVDKLELEIDAGMTAITGETGAGKSILLGALGLTLGDRADADKVRNGKERADICATFDLSTITSAKEWLIKQELSNDSECLLRRVVTRDGRSRGYINGKPVPIAQLKELGEMLIDIHSQHAHQSLLKKTNHLHLLDNFANDPHLLDQCRKNYKLWQKQLNQFTTLKNNAAEAGARLQLLRYQVQELDELAIELGELEKLEHEQRILSSAEITLQASQQASNLCDDDDHGLLQKLSSVIQLMGNIQNKPESLTNAHELFINAQIEIQEAQHELRHYVDTFELDHDRLPIIESRLSSIYEIARKHKISAEELLNFHTQLSEELSLLDLSEDQLLELEQAAQAAFLDFFSSAEQLSKQRQDTAKILQKTINSELHNLSMKNAHIEISHTAFDQNQAEKASSNGIDDIEILISTNPGQAPKSLIKVASGGELSRVSLAIQVVTAQSSSIPTLVFDEVDVGIGGATADIVGQLLRKLGNQGQVICVTHLPQVASKAHEHLEVHKDVDSSSAQSTLSKLNKNERIQEVARMMGGVNLTQQTISLAEEMINSGSMLKAG